MSIVTHGVKYIGSKKTLNPYIIQMINDNCESVKTAIDVFTGTTRVAQALRQNGLQVTTSDLSWASEAYANTFVHNHDNAHLAPIIEELNNLKPQADWITKNYCDVMSTDGNGGVVRVWQEKNGMKADAIRNHIETLTDLEPWERFTLITSLIFALDAVDNTVGVQQAYLKQWCTRSHKDMVLRLPQMIWNPFTSDEPPIGTHIVGNALDNNYPSADLAYLDPPYSAHSYASYYHIWDSITKWDKPEVDLKTNRRADRVTKNDAYDNSFESLFNRKREAAEAFGNVISRLDTRYVLISYNNESLVNQQDLFDLCYQYGNVTIERIDYKRNVMCKIGNMADGAVVQDKNQELLILIEK